MLIRRHKRRYPKLPDWLKCKLGWWTEHLKMVGHQGILEEGSLIWITVLPQLLHVLRNRIQCAYFFIYSCRSVCPSYSRLADSPATLAHFAAICFIALRPASDVTSEWQPWEMVHGLRPQCQ